jgi:hypothetical protein
MKPTGIFALRDIPCQPCDDADCRFPRGGIHSDLAVLLAPHLHQSGLKMADQTLLRLLARIAPFCLNEDGRLRITHTIFTQTLTALSPLMSPSRRALVARFNQRDAFSVAERTYQWMALENYEQLVETLGHVDAFCALQQSYPELASQAMLSLGAGRSSFRCYYMRWWKTGMSGALRWCLRPQ